MWVAKGATTWVNVVKSLYQIEQSMAPDRARPHLRNTSLPEGALQSDRTLEILRRHQSGIAAILDEARQPLASVDASQMKALALLRWELTRILRQYQLFKHTEIFDPVIRTGTAARSTAAAALKRRCLELGEAYAAHVARWSLQGPAAAWEDYQREAVDLTGRIEQHLAAEMREVTDLLRGTARTRKP